MKSLKNTCFLAVSLCLAATANAQIVLIDDGTFSALDPKVSTVGTWSYRTEAQHGGTYLTTGSRFANNVNPSSITYGTQLPTSGLWALEIWTTNTLNHNDRTATITHGDGTASSNLTVNQLSMNAASRNQWLSLGIYDFTNTAATYNYTLNTSATQQNSDAVRWVNMSNN